MDSVELARVNDAIADLRARVLAAPYGQRALLNEQLNELRRQHWRLTHPRPRP